MIFTETHLKGAFTIEINKIKDDRGFFGRSWCINEMKEAGLNTMIRQSNTSLSLKKGTLRGMHYQKEPYQETKLIRCTRGSVFDVIIDLREDSPTFRQWFGMELTQDNYKMLYVPEDFAHGYLTLEDNSEVTYMVTQFYNAGAEAGIRWNDPVFDIQWPVIPTVISEKDRTLPDYEIILHHK